MEKFRPETVRFEIGDGTEVYCFNSPDGLWRIRARYLVPRITGLPDFERLNAKMNPSGAASVTDVGLAIPGANIVLPEELKNRTFISAKEAEDCVLRSLATRHQA